MQEPNLIQCADCNHRFIGYDARPGCHKRHLIVNIRAKRKCDDFSHGDDGVNPYKEYQG